MSKTTYLVISGILSFKYLNNNLLPFITDDILLMAMLSWTIFGFIYYKENSPLYTLKNQTLIFIISVLFFFSALTPVFSYGQPFISTCIAMRGNLIIIFLLLLFKIMPTEKEIFKSFQILTIIALILSILVILYPQLFADKEIIMNLLARQKRGSTDIAVIWPGSRVVIFYFFMQLYYMIEKKSMKEFLICTILIGYIILQQNRSTLICAIPFYLYGLIKSNIRYKMTIISIIIIACGTYIIMVLSELLKETQNQLSDPQYNRWQAIQAYLFERDYTLYNTLFGKGFPCKGSLYIEEIKKFLIHRNAILSDIGLLGSFYFYGIILMSILYWYIFKGLFSKGMPIYVRLYSLWMLVIPTIHCFFQGSAFGASIIILIHIYFVIYHSNKEYATN